MEPVDITKLTLSDMRPKRANGATLLLGYIIGHAVGIIQAVSADKEQVVRGLKGVFEAYLIDGENTVIARLRSNKLFIAAPHGDSILPHLEDGVYAVDFGYAVSVSGDTWRMDEIVPPEIQHDPLYRLRNAMPTS